MWWKWRRVDNRSYVKWRSLSSHSYLSCWKWGRGDRYSSRRCGKWLRGDNRSCGKWRSGDYRSPDMWSGKLWDIPSRQGDHMVFGHPLRIVCRISMCQVTLLVRVWPLGVDYAEIVPPLSLLLLISPFRLIAPPIFLILGLRPMLIGFILVRRSEIGVLSGQRNLASADPSRLTTGGRKCGMVNGF